jgi:hypothetical protein
VARLRHVIECARRTSCGRATLCPTSLADIA